MSGGHFDYKQHHITDIAEEIKQIISREHEDSVNEYGDATSYGFTKETIAEFEEAITLLEKAAIYAHRIDWLISGDDGEDSFHSRLAEELA